MIPISKDIIEPVIISNIQYVNDIEEFEKIELRLNETRLVFDNFNQCFYIRSRDKFGEYSPIKIFFYDNFFQKVQSIEKEEFIKHCKDAGLNYLKTEIACLFFLENKTPQDVWLWLLETGKKDWSWDYVRNLKCNLKKKLFNKI